MAKKEPEFHVYVGFVYVGFVLVGFVLVGFVYVGFVLFFAIIETWIVTNLANKKG